MSSQPVRVTASRRSFNELPNVCLTVLPKLIRVARAGASRLLTPCVAMTAAVTNPTATTSSTSLRLSAATADSQPERDCDRAEDQGGEQRPQWPGQAHGDARRGERPALQASRWAHTQHGHGGRPQAERRADLQCLRVDDPHQRQRAGVSAISVTATAGRPHSASR